ncbi:MAG: flagellar basal body-associated FliL family protein [Myxococcota bacterium]
MADDENLDDEEIVPPSNNRMMLIIVAVNVLAAAGIGGYMFMGSGGGEGEAKAAEPEAVVDPGAPPVLVAMEPFIVNLKEPGGTRYLKMVIQIEVPGEKGQGIMTTRIAPVRDRIIASTSELTFADTQGADRKRSIRQTLVKEVNEVLKAEVAKDIYFTEFVIQ